MKGIFLIIIVVFVSIGNGFCQSQKNEKKTLLYDDYKDVTFLIRKVELYGMNCQKNSGKPKYCEKVFKYWDKRYYKNKTNQLYYLENSKINYNLITLSQSVSEEYEINKYPYFIDYKPRIQHTPNGSYVFVSLYLVNRRTNSRTEMRIISNSMNMMSSLKNFIKKIEEHKDIKPVLFTSK